MTEPVELNYVLYWDGDDLAPAASFIPPAAVAIAGDKRLQAQLFKAASVPTPETLLIERPEEVYSVLAGHRGARWVLKNPVGCGATGHQLLTEASQLRADWPRPFIVQRLVEMAEPAVYRAYAAGGAPFGWNVRKFPPESTRSSPFVAHATGASYYVLGDVPPDAQPVVTAALQATGLDASFACVDLLDTSDGWLVLEVGTDGLHNHVDRDVPEPLYTELEHRVAEAFWGRVGRPPPWGKIWRRRRTHAQLPLPE